MEIVYRPTPEIKRIMPLQNEDDSKTYRWSNYVIKKEFDGVVGLLNATTYELIYLSQEEYNQIDNKDEIRKYLIEHYFLVEKDFDEKKFTCQLVDLLEKTDMIFTTPALNHFVILPTTGCNARCFYCFEHGVKPKTMTEQTAKDVAGFIKRKSKGKKISIRWFGGEPLVNNRVIDIISKDLKEAGIEFSASMTTNGYLFDDEIAEKAATLWNLKVVQITLDGTEEVYNKIKNYVYKTDESPFYRVLANIERLLKKRIRVSIRLNLGEENAEDMEKLLKQLVERFNKYKNCYIYVARLFDEDCSGVLIYGKEKRQKLMKIQDKFQAYIKTNMPQEHQKALPSFKRVSRCIANKNNSVLISPEGKLGKCEHFVDSNFIGSIYSDEIDVDMLNNYKKRAHVIKECPDCKFYYLCQRLECCSAKPKVCDDWDKKHVAENYDDAISAIYKVYKTQKEKGNLDNEKS